MLSNKESSFRLNTFTKTRNPRSASLKTSTALFDVNRYQPSSFGFPHFTWFTSQEVRMVNRHDFFWFYLSTCDSLLGFRGGCRPAKLNVMLTRQDIAAMIQQVFLTKCWKQLTSNIWRVLKLRVQPEVLLLTRLKGFFFCLVDAYIHWSTVSPGLWITPTQHSNPHSQRKQAAGIYSGFPWKHYQWNFGLRVLKHSEWGFWNSIRLQSSEHIVWSE